MQQLASCTQEKIDQDCKQNKSEIRLEPLSPNLLMVCNVDISQTAFHSELQDFLDSSRQLKACRKWVCVHTNAPVLHLAPVPRQLISVEGKLAHEKSSSTAFEAFLLKVLDPFPGPELKYC